MRSVNFCADNNIVLLHNGAAFFPALIAAIDAARVEIYLETYIFSLDETGVLVRDALQRAAARGVVVSVISDWLGTGIKHSRLLRTTLHAAGVHHRSFNPWFKRGVARSHRKLCVIDRYVAFVGGLNIIDDLYSDDSRRTPLPAPRWDFAVAISGPLVPVIHEEMQDQWVRIGQMKLRARWENFKKMRASRHFQVYGAALAGLVVRDNWRNRRTIQRAYLQALGRARESAYLTNPYFAPAASCGARWKRRRRVACA